MKIITGFMKKLLSPFSSDENYVHFTIHIQIKFLCHNKFKKFQIETALTA